MKPNLKQPRKLMLVNATLFLVLGLVVLGGAYFANTASGQGPRAGITKVWGLELMPPEKQTVMARSFPTDDPKAFVAPPGAPTPILPTLEPQPTGIPSNMPHRTAGAGVIVENGGGAAPLNHGYYVVNGWLATTNGEKIRVFAGGVWNDPLYTERSQGFVSVVYQSLDYSRFTRPQVTVETPTKTGALTIVDATGMKLKLQSEQGITYFFDVNTGKFVSQ